MTATEQDTETEIEIDIVEDIEPATEPEEATCDHDWRIQDDSFDHEFGTEIVVCWVCEECGETRPYRRGDDGGPEE